MNQVNSLKEANISAAYINSSLSYSQSQKVLSNVLDKKYKLIYYVAPERLSDDEFVKTIQKTNVSFVAIDEAHCISQWGVDFRPDNFGIF